MRGVRCTRAPLCLCDGLQACLNLPGEWQNQCLLYIDQLGAPSCVLTRPARPPRNACHSAHARADGVRACAGTQAFAYIQAMDPTTICTNFGACLPGQQLLQLPRNFTVPPLPPALVAKAAQLRARAHELSASNDFCDTCKVVITEAAVILGNLVRTHCSLLGTSLAVLAMEDLISRDPGLRSGPSGHSARCCGSAFEGRSDDANFFHCKQDTQKQILEYAKEACTALGPNLHDQCLNYVELYGPLVVNMLVQVRTLCTMFSRVLAMEVLIVML